MPKSYDLQLEPDLEKFTFDGRVTVRVEVKEETLSLTFHTLELSLSSAVFATVSVAQGLCAILMLLVVGTE